MDEQTRIMMEQVAEEASVRAIKRTLTSLGMDHTQPIEVQKDMASLRHFRKIIDDPEFQADMLHLRKWRKALDAVQNKSILASIGVIVAGALAATWIGIQHMIGR